MLAFNGPWGTQTFIAGLTQNTLIAPWVINGAMNGVAFDTYFEMQLVPVLDMIRPPKQDEPHLILNGNPSRFRFRPKSFNATSFDDVNASSIAPGSAFTLELLHFSNQEANAATIDNIDNLPAVLNALQAEDLGNDGDDFIFDDRGRDVIKEGGDNEALFGGHGRGTIYGGEGDDLINGGRGRDKLDGGEGDDIFVNVDGGDVFHFYRNFGNDEVYGDEIEIDQLLFAKVNDDDIMIEEVDGTRAVTVSGEETFGTVRIFDDEYEDNSLPFA